VGDGVEAACVDVVVGRGVDVVVGVVLGRGVDVVVGLGVVVAAGGIDEPLPHATASVTEAIAMGSFPITVIC